jgi:hypothetical protein
VPLACAGNVYPHHMRVSKLLEWQQKNGRRLILNTSTSDNISAADAANEMVACASS